MTQLPVISMLTWLFYAGNVLLIAAYLVVCALLLRPRGFSGRGQLNPTVTTVTVLFFVTCALLHAELAYDAWAHPDGIRVRFTLLILAKLALVVLFMVVSNLRASKAADERSAFDPHPDHDTYRRDEDLLSPDRERGTPGSTS